MSGAGIGFVAYSPLGRGFLTGRFSRSMTSPPTTAPAEPRFQGDNFQEETSMWAAVERLARHKGCTPANSR